MVNESSVENRKFCHECLQISLSKSDNFSVRWVQDDARQTVFQKKIRYKPLIGCFKKAFENILDLVPRTKRVKMTLKLFLLD